MIIDTHAHLFYENFNEDLENVLNSAIAQNITHLINVGTDVKTSKQALLQINQIKQNIIFYSSVGIHPHEAMTYAENQGQILEDVKKLEDIYRTNPEKVVAVGECGLDYFYPTDRQAKELQKQLLKMQVNLAKNLSLPLIIHCRDAWGDIFDLVQNHCGVFHCYTGDENIARKILDTNFYISFTAIVTYPKNDYLRQVIKTLPLDRILVETDCPFLPPQTKRGQRNEPANIIETLQTIADVKGISRQELDEAIYHNTKKLFKFI